MIAGSIDLLMRLVTETLAKDAAKAADILVQINSSVGRSADEVCALVQRSGDAAISAMKGVAPAAQSAGAAIRQMGQESQTAAAGVASVNKEVSALMNKSAPSGGSFFGQMATEAAQAADASKVAAAQIANATKETDAAGTSARGLGLHTAYARQEVIVLAHEMLQGNFNRIPGSLMVLAERMNLSHAALLSWGIPVAAAAVVLGTFIYALVKGHNEMETMNADLMKSGDIAGMTRGSMLEMAHTLSETGDISLATGKSVVEALVGSGKVAQESFIPIASLANDFIRKMGVEADKVGPALLKVFADPVKGAEKLNESMHFLNLTQLEHIQQLGRQGLATQAQIAVAEALKGKFDAQAERVGTLTAVWRKLAQAASEAWDKMLAMGRDSTIQERVTAQQKIVDDLQNRIDVAKNGKSGLHNADKLEADLAAQKRALDVLQNLAAARGKEADAAAKVAEESKAAALWSAEVGKTRQGQLRDLEDEKTRATNLYNTLKGAAQTDEQRVKLAKQYGVIQDDINRRISDLAAKGQDRLGGLTMDLDGQKMEITKAKQLYEERLTMLDFYHKKLGMSEEDWQAGRQVARDTFNAQEKAAYDRQFETLISFVPRNKTELDRLAEDYARVDAAHEKHNTEMGKAGVLENLEGLHEKAKALADEEKAWKKITEAEDKAGKSQIDHAMKALAAVEKHGEAIGKSKQQIELEAAAETKASTDSLEFEKQILTAVLMQDEAEPRIIEKDKARLQVVTMLLGIYERIAQVHLDNAAAEQEKASAAAMFEQMKVGLDSVKKTAEADGGLAAWIGAQDAANDIMNKLLPALRVQAEAMRALAILNDDPELAKRADAFTKSINDLIAKNSNFASQISKAWNQAGDNISSAMGKAFGDVGQKAGNVFKIWTTGVATASSLDNNYNELVRKNGAATAEETEKYQRAKAINELQTYGNMAGAAAEFFDKNSKGYAVMMGISKAFHAAELAMQLAGIATKLMAGAATMFGQSGWGGFAGVAAMGAVMAGLGYAMSGGTSAKMPSAAEAEKTQGSGTVLGDESAKSNSIANSLKAIQALNTLGLTFTQEMAASLRSIDASMSHLATSLSVSGLTTGAVGDDVQTGRIGRAGGILSNRAVFGLPDFTDMMPFAAKIRDWLFGTITASITNSGIGLSGTLAQMFLDPIIDNLHNYVQGINAFFTVSIKEGGGIFGGSGSQTDHDEWRQIDPTVLRQVRGLLSGMVDSVEEAVRALGLWTPELHNYLMSLPLDMKLSIDGLKGQELTDAVNHFFSSIADRIAVAGVPGGTTNGIFMDGSFFTGDNNGFAGFQQAGEGAFQTLIRIATEVDVVTHTFAALGLTLGPLSMTTFKAVDAIVQLMGGLDKFQQSVASYVSHYYSPQEQHDMTGRALTADFAGQGLGMPTGISGFRAMIDSLFSDGKLTNGLRITDAAGQALYAHLMQIEGTFYDWTNSIVGADGKLHSLEEVTQQHADLNDRLRLAQAGINDDKRASIQQEIEDAKLRASAFDDESKATIELVIAAEAYNVYAAKQVAINKTNADLQAALDVATGKRTQQSVDRDRAMADIVANLGKTTNQTTIDIQKQVWAQEDLNAAMSAKASLMDQFGTAQQKFDIAMSQVNEQFSAMGMAVPKTSEELANYIATLDPATEHGKAMIAMLTALAPALRTVVDQVPLISKGPAQVSDPFAAIKTAQATQIDLDKQLYEATHSVNQVLETNRAARLNELRIQEEAAGMTHHELVNTQLAIYAEEDLAAARKAVVDATEAAGIGTSSLSDAIKAGLLDSSAGKDIGQMIMDGIRNALATQASNQIADIITKYLISPIMTSIIEGGATTAAIETALNQTNIDLMVTAATKAIDAITTLFNNEDFQKALAAIGKAVNSIHGFGGGTASQPVQTGPGENMQYVVDASGFGFWKALPAASDAANLLSQHLALLAQIAEITGDEVLAASVKEQQRQIALKDLDSSLIADTKRLWQLQDDDEKKKKAAEITKTQHDLDIQLLEAQGRAEEALAAKRADILEALATDQQRATQIAIWAAEAAATWKKTMEDFAKSLTDFLHDIRLTDASPLTPNQRLELANSNYIEDALKAGQNDKEGEDARGRYTNDAQALLREAEAVYGKGSVDYNRIFRMVEAETQALIDQGMDPNHTAASLDDVSTILIRNGDTSKAQTDALIEEVKTLNTTMTDLKTKLEANGDRVADSTDALADAVLEDLPRKISAAVLDSSSGGRLSTR